MAELTQAQENLIATYSSYDEQELYNLLGNQVAEFGSESVRESYVFGTPNILDRGKKYLAHTGGSFAETVCPVRQEAARKLSEFRQKHPDSLLPVAWTVTLLDIGLAHVTGGVPPITVALTLGKICDYSIDKFCKKFKPGDAPV